MATPTCSPPEVPKVPVRVPVSSAVPVCDPLKPVKSSAQNELDSSLSKPVGAYPTFTMTSKYGDLVVPKNVHVRFYNCTFDNFDATQGNNAFYFEQCVFKEKPVMKDVVAIAAGTTFTKGALITQTKIELIAHETPESSKPCSVNDTFRCEDHSLLKSMGTTFEWLADGFEEIADDMIRSMGILQEAAMICGVLTAQVTGIVSWANKAMVFLTSFSKFECMLDKFLNIPFTILNMIDGCVAKMVGIAFGVLDALLAPFFSCVSSITSMFNSINSLISTVKGIPDRIANMANGCYLRILDTAQIIVKKVAFTLDLKSRVELQLNQRIMSVNGAIADLENGSKMVLRNCGVVTSPTKGNLIPLFKVETNSFLDMSRIKFLNTAHAPLFKVGSGGRVKVSAQKVESTAPPNSAPLVIADKGTVEVDFEEVTSENTLLSGKDSTFVYDKLGNVTLRGQNAYVGDFDNCMA